MTLHNYNHPPLYKIGWDSTGSLNDIDPTVPEFWSQGVLAEMVKHTVMLPLVNRAYNEAFQVAGDTVNVPIMSDLFMTRKRQNDDMTIQTVRHRTIPVTLDQQPTIAIELHEHELRRTNLKGITRYIQKISEGLVNGIEAVLLGQQYDFWQQAAGGIGTALNDGAMLDLVEIFRRRSMPQSGRNVVIGALQERDVLDIERYVEQDKSGGGMGNPLATGMIGSCRGFDIHVTNFGAEIVPPATLNLGAVDEALNVAAGTSTIAVDGFTGTVPVGSWCLIEGNDRPQKITAVALTGGDLTSITVSPPVKKPVEDDAVVTIYPTGTINKVGGYPQHWPTAIKITTAEPLQVGTGITIAGHENTYTIIGTYEDDTELYEINRPLTQPVDNGDTVFIMPAGNFGLAFHRDAITFVNAPLEAPGENTGVRAVTLNANGLAVRIMMSFNHRRGMWLISGDTLAAVTTLDQRYGALICR